MEADETWFPPIDDGEEPVQSPALLNEPQARAASHEGGPLLVFAGAGSGKTRVITYRIANLVATLRVPPYRILAVTFTNKAAGEMRARLEKLIGQDLTKDLWVGTFHAVCAKLLRRHHEAAGLTRSFLIYDDTDQRAVMSRVFKKLKIDDRRYPPRQVLGRIHKEKQEGNAAKDFIPGNYMDDVIKLCFDAYEFELQQANAVDFDDLLLKVMTVVEDTESAAGLELRKKFRYLLVDEFQDVNRVQYRIVRALAAEHRNICVVGDDDQSIYRWRGADVRIVRGFRKDYAEAEVVKLEENYRSSKNIVAAALGVISRSSEREPKSLFTENPEGEKVMIVAAASERDEAAFVAEEMKRAISSGISPAEIAVFYRVHAQSRVLEEVMRAERIPYQVIGGQRFFERAEIKDLLSYLRILENPASNVDLLRIINVPSRKIGDTTIERLAERADGRGLSLYDAIVELVKSDVIGPQAKKALARFHALIEELKNIAKTAPPSELASTVLELSGYLKALENDDSPEAEGRIGNLEEFVASIGEYESEIAAQGETPDLAGYLERVTLAAATDELKDAPRVALMTVHAAKGLEFTEVYLTGMEEDVFPFRSQDRPTDEEEERRLAYVAITRARKKLAIIHAERRMIFGQTRLGTPSRFIAEIPESAKRAEQTSLAKAGYGRFIDRDWSSSSAPTNATRRPEAGQPWRSQPAQGGYASRSSGSHGQEAPRAAPQRQAGERYIDREDVGQGEGLRPGATVTHATFGVGTITNIDAGHDPTATVRFSGWAPKRIKMRYLQVVE